MQERFEKDTLLKNQAYDLLKVNDSEGLRSLIQNNPWLLQARYSSNSTLLHVACSNDQADMADLLLTLGADVNAPGGDENTPLRWGIENAGLDTVNVFIRHKANLDAGCPLYWAAVASRKAGVVEALIKAGARSRGNDVFYKAVLRGDEALVNVFIDHGFSVNTSDAEGNSLLTWAACNDSDARHYRIAKKLLSLGADVNAKNIWGRTALFWAVSSSFKSKPLLDLTTLYLAHNAKMDSCDKEGVTPLLEAAQNAELPMIKLLFDSASNIAIDLDHKDHAGMGLLHYAALNHHEGVCQYFIDKGLACNDTDRLGMSPLHDACYCARYHNIRALLQANARTDIRDKTGETALNILIKRRSDYEKSNPKFQECLQQFQALTDSSNIESAQTGSTNPRAFFQQEDSESRAEQIRGYALTC